MTACWPSRRVDSGSGEAADAREARTGRVAGRGGSTGFGSGRVAYGPAFDALAQVGRFVRPGAQVIASASTGSGVESAAFTNADGGTVLVAFNDDVAAHAVAVKDGARSFGFALPAGAAATFLWRD